MFLIQWENEIVIYTGVFWNFNYYCYSLPLFGPSKNVPDTTFLICFFSYLVWVFVIDFIIKGEAGWSKDKKELKWNFHSWRTANTAMILFQHLLKIYILRIFSNWNECYLIFLLSLTHVHGGYQRPLTEVIRYLELPNKNVRRYCPVLCCVTEWMRFLWLRVLMFKWGKLYVTPAFIQNS